jgi:transcriptional regulator with XRE-family HTH domain
VREFAITPETVISLLIAGMRLRLHKSPAQLAQLLGVSKEDVEDWEAGHADAIPVKDFVAAMDKMGVRLVAQVPFLTGMLDQPRPLVNDEAPKPEPAMEIITVELVPDPPLVPVSTVAPPVLMPGGRLEPRTIHLTDSSQLAHYLRMARLRLGKKQFEVAADLGINASTLSRHESEGGNVTLEVLAAYAAYFNINFVVGRRHAEAA